MRKYILAFLAVLTVATVTGVALADDPNGHLATAQGLIDQAQAELDAAIAEPPITVTQTATVTTTQTVTQTVTAPPTTPPPTTPPPSGCTGIQLAPGANLETAATSNPPGTTFCLANGTYTVAHPILYDEGDQWINTAAAKVTGWTPSSTTFWATVPAARLVSATGEPLFKSTGDGNGSVSVFRGLDLSGAIDGVGGYIGQAIGAAGRPLSLELSRVHDNVGPAIASWSGDIIDTELDHNGGASGGQGGLKSVAGDAHATRIFFHHNLNGINCDFCIVADGDGPYSVVDSRITDNQAVGLKTEVSDVGTTFTGNVVLRNNLSNQSTNAGIRSLSSSNVLIANNIFDDNLVAGIMVQKDNRVGSITNVRVQTNTMNGDAIVGCTLSGVTCSGNS